MEASDTGTAEKDPEVTVHIFSSQISEFML